MLKIKKPSAVEMEKALRAMGYRMTRQRRAILKYMSRTSIHPTARQVFKDVSQVCRGLSVATVYNTLGTLASLGLLKVMEFESFDNRYENNLALHVNLVCTSCSEVQDLADEAPIMVQKAKDEMNFHVLDCRKEYYGICSGCRSLFEGEGIQKVS